ncbi:hypothetical protein HIM_02290 [Hirsutella minnesotensis 3608]|nr:hypothetical protein HIM_02290 [Hirsutella minnesotensis 3608]
MDSGAQEQKPLVVYDIASAPPRRTFAPNPWKARSALNFKAANYRTQWVELPDVESTRKGLGVPASRQFPDGTDFFTLPVLHDTEKNQFAGDTFDIALYLDEKYPDGPRLIPEGTVGVTKAWNDRVDALFSRFVRLNAHGTPLNPENAETCRQILVDRGRKFVPASCPLTWDDLAVTGDERRKTFAEYKEALGELEAYYRYAADKEGPFLNGRQPVYADLIVAGWLGYSRATMPDDEWADLASWHNGRWGKIWNGLADYTKMV